MQSKNPYTEEIIKNYEELSEAEIEVKLAEAQKAFLAWRETSFSERAGLLLNLAKNLREQKEDLAKIITSEMGKLFKESLGEVEKCALACEFYAENGERFLAPEIIETDASKSYARFDPLGIILAVMPWNYPFWQVMRFAAPAVMAGNVGILKHASNVPGCGEALERLFVESDFPEGVFQNLLIGSAKVEKIIADPRVKAATLTGSEYAGSQVAMQAGKELKKTVLELGGSDPLIILKDADLSEACLAGAKSRLLSCGQTCIAAKRFIVEKSIADEFLAKLKTTFENLKLGDPMDEATQLGPLATKSGLAEIEKQVREAIREGAELITGGQKWGNQGYFYEPTILTNIQKNTKLYSEEIFGPVISFFVVENAEEAIKLANDSEFGLGAAIWTKDLKLAEEMAQKIEAGAVFINGIVKSDPRLPFGGIKKSGYGRELSPYGMKEFVNIKTVWVA